MKNKVLIVMGLMATLPLVYSCGNKTQSSNASVDSVATDTVVTTTNDTQEADIADFVSYFNNGEYAFVKVYSGKEKASLYDGDKKLIALGKMYSNADDVLTYDMDNGSVVKVYLNEPKMIVKNGDEEKSFVLISPNEETYVSLDKKDTLKAVYRPEESVTLITKDATLVLKQASASADGAQYVGSDDSTMTWTTHMNNAFLKKDGKQVKYTTDGKSKLPESCLK